MASNPLPSPQVVVEDDDIEESTGLQHAERLRQIASDHDERSAVHSPDRGAHRVARERVIVDDQHRSLLAGLTVPA